MSYLACEAHGGRLVRALQDRGAGEEPVWACAGFDGEAFGWCTAGPVPEQAAARLLAGETYWPGVLVMTGDGSVTGLQRVPSSEKLREMVNDLLRRGPVS